MPPRRPQKPRPKRRGDPQHKKGARGHGAPHAGHGERTLWIYGRHAAAAAIANPNREIHRVCGTKQGLQWLAKALDQDIGVGAIEPMASDALAALLTNGAVHQGLAVQADRLPVSSLEDACAPAEPGRPVVVLDQITDPQNIGAIFRSAAAFGARAVIVHERRTPALAGALAKAAAGAVETMACCRVVNVARALSALREMGYFAAGLAGDGDTLIQDLPTAQPMAVVLGAEGDGLRPLVAKSCDGLYRIEIAPNSESLNVSNAAAVALFVASTV
ncbi:MAG: RNA methyltransferase [Pseudomonadota bacterium]